MKRVTVYHWLDRNLLQSASQNEDVRRKEYVLNTLLLGTLVLAMASLLSAAISHITRQSDYTVTSLWVLFAINLFFAGLLVLSHHGFARPVAYIFVSVLFSLATYSIVIWGILLPQAVLTYSLLIVIAGVLLESKAAFRVAFIMTAAMLIIKHFEDIHELHFNTSWMHQTGGYNDIIVYGITFLIIAEVAWLSNREIERSLIRARKSEKDLRIERNSLELKVKQRTKELERAQVEKLLELHRFAEFGRFSSTLLHELTNPLTAVSLNLEQLELSQASGLVQQARQGIAYMEHYVDAARRQLRNESEIKIFSVSQEIERVIGLLEPKARRSHVTINAHFTPDLEIKGDSIHFNQIFANLIANAIDAYSDIDTSHKLVDVLTEARGEDVHITVSDHGVGIAPRHLKAIFEPFFTTKTVQRGTGLGLTITKKIVEEDFKGTIVAESDKHYGTRFKLILPLS